MRLDKFLKVSRIIKRRTIASDICTGAHVFVNDYPSKPSKQINAGDIITIEYKVKILKIRILKVPSGNVSINEAGGLYEIIEENFCR